MVRNTHHRSHLGRTNGHATLRHHTPRTPRTRRTTHPRRHRRRPRPLAALQQRTRHPHPKTRTCMAPPKQKPARPHPHHPPMRIPLHRTTRNHPRHRPPTHTRKPALLTKGPAWTSTKRSRASSAKQTTQTNSVYSSKSAPSNSTSGSTPHENSHARSSPPQTVP